MNLFLLQQAEADVPRGDDWLGAGERRILSGLRFAKRRADWRLGRWTAKCAIAAYLGRVGETGVFGEIEIRPAASGAPEIFVAGAPPDISISLSHRAGVALCALAPSPISLGCDLEVIEPRSEAFIADYFAREEQAAVEGAPACRRPALLGLLWSAKESALKTLHQGLRLDTRSVVIDLPGGLPIFGGEVSAACSPAAACPPMSNRDPWQILQVRCADRDHILYGWWQCKGNLVRTVVADEPLRPPVWMNPPHHRPGEIPAPSDEPSRFSAGSRQTASSVSH